MVKAKRDNKVYDPDELLYSQSFMMVLSENWWWNVYVFSIEWSEIYTPKVKGGKKSFIVTHPLDKQSMTMVTLNRIYKNDLNI